MIFVIDRAVYKISKDIDKKIDIQKPSYILALVYRAWSSYGKKTSYGCIQLLQVSKKSLY